NLHEYLACLSEDFKFHFTEEDQQGWPQLPPWFYKSDEQQVHENMFGDEWDVESITLTLTVAFVETIPGGDLHTPARDVVVIRAETDLRVSLAGGTTYLATSPQEFYFRTVVDSEEREGRVLWEMFEWHDLEGWDDGARDEETGWGRIKHFYLESLSEPSRRTSPADVIQQLRDSYIAMGVVDYLDCLSEDFVFYPCEDDVQNPDLEIPPEWYKPDEQMMHENMFAEDSDVESISLTLTNVSIEYVEGLPGDPSDDVYIYVEDVDLRVNLYGGLTYLATAPSEFHLRVDADEEGPYGETMWDIYEWYDNPLRGGEAVAGRTQSASWGGIKAMYW
ncbi:MAG: hypothetical protein KAJ04_02770, partial [Candidatus Eisenbacteria sp.]|nr:hypothetical protein [Candidatus Eisenbacteria bacterium]